MSRGGPTDTDATTKVVYGLVDPLDMTVRYVGATVNAESRLGQHMLQARSYKNRKPGSRDAWLWELEGAGYLPLMIRFGQLPIAVAEDAEFKIIQAVSQAGQLTNNRGRRRFYEPVDERTVRDDVRDLARSLLALTEDEDEA